MLQISITETKGSVKYEDKRVGESSVRALKWLLLASSKDNRRYMLKNVIKTAIRGEDCLCATDGRRIHALKLKHYTFLSRFLEYDKPYAVRLSKGGVEFSPVDGNYPNLRQLIPSIGDFGRAAIEVKNRDAFCSAVGYLGVCVNADYAKDASALGKTFRIYKGNYMVLAVFDEGFAVIMELRADVDEISPEDGFPFAAPPPDFSPDWSLNTPDAGAVESEVCCG